MSKAFTRESDDEAEVVPPPRPALPFGVKNYVTRAGADRLREELVRLLADHSEATKHTREARIRQLQEILPTLVIAEPPAEKDVVRFGARITVQRRGGSETYRLVGVDETDLDANEISWISPLAKSLLGKRVGDRVRFGGPSEAEEIVLLAVSYE
jgi:transcription elongation factor GreB